MMIFKMPSVAGAAIISPTQTYHRSRARRKARSNRSEPGRSSCELPARLMTRIAARTGGEARARSASRTAVSPGREDVKPTASASARKQPALAIRTPRRLRRGGKPGATAAAIADEPQHAPAAALMERYRAVAIAPFVASPPRTNHADHASDLPVRRLDVEDPVIRAVVLNHQEDRRSEEHTSELQSRFDVVCRLLLEKKKAARTLKSVTSTMSWRDRSAATCHPMCSNIYTIHS